jgi:hypothetical protein
MPPPELNASMGSEELYADVYASVTLAPLGAIARLDHALFRQSAATLQQIGAAFQVIGTPGVKTADDSVTNYLRTTCGINTSPSP